MGIVVPCSGGIKTNSGPSLLKTQKKVHIGPLRREATDCRLSMEN
jgi:hypothetical protein